MANSSADKISTSPFTKPNLYKPNDPPLLSFQVTNPITYFKLWFKKVWASEGLILHLRIKPLTIIIVALLFTGTGLGINKHVISYLSLVPGLEYINPTPTPSFTPTPTVTINSWVNAAYSGILHKSESDRFYLVISSGEAITLEAPGNINLSILAGKRVLAYGSFNQETKLLKVEDASDMEILPTKTMLVPTVAPITPAP